MSLPNLIMLLWIQVYTDCVENCYGRQSGLLTCITDRDSHPEYPETDRTCQVRVVRTTGSQHEPVWSTYRTC